VNLLRCSNKWGGVAATFHRHDFRPARAKDYDSTACAKSASNPNRLSVPISPWC
jgi:hypothetical protein